MTLRPQPSVGYLMNAGARLLRRLADARLRPLGLSSGHLPVINALMEQPALSQKALAEIAGIEQPTMAATLARMERDSIITGEPDPYDRRSVRYSLTSATRAKAATLTAEIDRMSADALADLSEEERSRLRAMLARMISTLERAL